MHTYMYILIREAAQRLQTVWATEIDARPSRQDLWLARAGHQAISIHQKSWGAVPFASLRAVNQAVAISSLLLKWLEVPQQA